MQGKQVDIESIVAKSIEDKLGIPASWCSGEAAEAAPVLLDASMFMSQPATQNAEMNALDLSQKCTPMDSSPVEK